MEIIKGPPCLMELITARQPWQLIWLPGLGPERFGTPRRGEPGPSGRPACCDGIATVLAWCCPLRYPLGIPWVSLLLLCGFRWHCGVSAEPPPAFDSIRLAVIQRKPHFPAASILSGFSPP